MAQTRPLQRLRANYAKSRLCSVLPSVSVHPSSFLCPGAAQVSQATRSLPPFYDESDAISMSRMTRWCQVMSDQSKCILNWQQRKRRACGGLAGSDRGLVHGARRKARPMINAARRASRFLVPFSCCPIRWTTRHESRRVSAGPARPVRPGGLGGAGKGPAPSIHMEQYTKGPLLGKGTFGEVVQATHNEVGPGNAGRDQLIAVWVPGNTDDMMATCGLMDG